MWSSSPLSLGEEEATDLEEVIWARQIISQKSSRGDGTFLHLASQQSNFLDPE